MTVASRHMQLSPIREMLHLYFESTHLFPRDQAFSSSLTRCMTAIRFCSKCINFQLQIIITTRCILSIEGSKVTTAAPRKSLLARLRFDPRLMPRSPQSLEEIKNLGAFTTFFALSSQ